MWQIPCAIIIEMCLEVEIMGHCLLHLDWPGKRRMNETESSWMTMRMYTPPEKVEFWGAFPKDVGQGAMQI